MRPYKGRDPERPKEEMWKKLNISTGSLELFMGLAGTGMAR